MQHELKQVEVRLKLTDKAGVFSMERIDTPDKAVSVLAPVLAGLDREEVCVVNLDGKGRPINFNVVSIGSVNASLVTGRELYKTAILSNAAGMIMLHNHPSSDLQMSVSDRNITEKMMYASLLLDIEFYDHVIVAGGTGKTFSIRENVPELFEPSHYAHLISHVADGVKEEVSYHGTSPVTYEILQIKDGSNGEQYRFWGMNYVQETGLQVNVSDYESKYQGELKPGETLDTLYERFNIHRPEDFTGHSLSVSDVIVLESGGDKRAFYVDSFGFCEIKDFFTEKLERSEITFTVAECGEFHSLGRYRDDVSNAEEAIALWKEYQKGPLNGIPSIGIQIHKPGQTEMEDTQVDLVSGKTIDLDMMRYYPEINAEETAIQKICELVENMHDIELVGKVPENVSAELILREFDLKQEIYNEEERSLIKEYAAQVKDMQKTRDLARNICYQEKIGNQDVALAMITARKEIGEMKMSKLRVVKKC